MTPNEPSTALPLIACLAKGIDEFNRGLFFECHETLEELWLAEEGPLSDFYQAIIQVAAGFHHLLRGNRRGAVTLLARGAQGLRPFTPRRLGVDVDVLIAEVDRCRRRLLELGEGRVGDFDRSLIPSVMFDRRQAEEEARGSA
jgi:predicted metal-dependent hydrolase